MVFVMVQHRRKAQPVTVILMVSPVAIITMVRGVLAAVIQRIAMSLAPNIARDIGTYVTEATATIMISILSQPHAIGLLMVFPAVLIPMVLGVLAVAIPLRVMSLARNPVQ
ncbi:MAG: hypothetical protein ABIC95_04425 [archaeon]